MSACGAPDRPVVLADLLDRAAARWPDRVAVSTAESAVTYAELAATSHRIAGRLAGLGVGRGDRVVLALPSGPAAVAALWGTARAGAAFVVLHEQVRGAALEHVLADSEPALLLTDDPAAAATAAALGVPACSAPPSALPTPMSAPAPIPPTPRPGHGWRQSRGFPEGSPTPRPTGTGGAPAQPVQLAQPEPAQPEPPAPPAGVQPLAVDPACLIYTSGSTATPKAVVCPHAAMVFAVEAIQAELRYRPDDVVYCPLPLSFDYGMYQLFLGAASGAHVRLGRPAEVGPSLLANLRSAGATVLAAVPAVAEALARLLRRSPATELPLRLLTSTGAAMPAAVPAALRARLPGLRVQLMFGLTECKRATIMPPDGDLARPGSSGRALPGTEVFAVGAAGERLPAGELGQLVVRGPHVMAGYWRQPELTAQRFPRAEGLFPQLHTGDYGWLDEAGYVYVAGRRDDVYKERGFRVSATEVEAAALRVPGVESAAVLPPAADRPASLLVVTARTAEEVLAGLRTELEEYKIPARCLVVPALPLTGNGKVDKKALAAALREVARA